MNLKTDFAFKTVFANEKEKALTISLLNEILSGRNKIEDIRYLLPEQLSNKKDDRRAIYDMYCTNEKKEQFIIEMQVIRQNYLIDRILYYSTFAIQQQALKGKWDYRLEPVYVIVLMDFTQWESNPDFINYHSLMNEETNEIISDNLKIITVELPKFKKAAEELATGLDRWLFCFNHLHELTEQPATMKGQVFNKLFEITETNKLTLHDMETYEQSRIDYWDSRIDKDYYRREGLREGREEGIISRNFQIAKGMKEMQMSEELISKLTGLTPQQIRQIK
jgi:predicted transposase/invertase (TIGR01784 family)